MEAESALVRADGAIELDPVAEVGLDLTVVVNPGHSESEYPVRLDKTLDDLSFLELGVLVVDFLDGLENFLDSLKIFANKNKKSCLFRCKCKE